MPYHVKRDPETKDLLIYRKNKDGSLNKDPRRIYIQHDEKLLDGEEGQKRIDKINNSEGVKELFALLGELKCPNAANFKTQYLEIQEKKRQAEEKERLTERVRRQAEEKQLAEEKLRCKPFVISFDAILNRIQFFAVNSKGENGQRATIQLDTEEEVNELRKSYPFFPTISSSRFPSEMPFDFSRYKKRGEEAKAECWKFFDEHLAPKKEEKPPKKNELSTG